MRFGTVLSTIALAVAITSGTASAEDFTVTCERGARVLVNARHSNEGRLLGNLSPAITGAVCDSTDTNRYVVENMPGNPVFSTIEAVSLFLKHIADNGAELQNGKPQS